MSFDWNDYYSLARFLSSYSGSECSKESALRSAISRMYYAVFKHALKYAVLNLRFEEKKRADDHGGLIYHYKNKGLHRVSRYLGDLRTWREQSDYQADAVINDAVVQQAFVKADRIIADLPLQ